MGYIFDYGVPFRIADVDTQMKRGNRESQTTVEIRSEAGVVV